MTPVLSLVEALLNRPSLTPDDAGCMAEAPPTWNPRWRPLSSPSPIWNPWRAAMKACWSACWSGNQLGHRREEIVLKYIVIPAQAGIQ